MPYNDYGSAMRERLGGRVQKLAIDVAMGCPNRDGSIARGGCTFCLGEAFSPSYCRNTDNISQQIDRAIEFHHQRRRSRDIYIAYFQAGTNTYAPIETLERVYSEALNHPAISGIIIGTRPDCIDSEKLDLLEYLSHEHYIAVEYGVESVYDTTLRRINRGHEFATAATSIEATRRRGITTGAHFILGLPGESSEDIVAGMDKINALELDTIKFHQLQIYRNTAIAEEWHKHPEEFLLSRSGAYERYVELIIEIVRHLDPRTAIDRFVTTAPHRLLVESPFAGLRPDAIRDTIISRMLSRGLHQGDLLIR